MTITPRQKIRALIYRSMRSLANLLIFADISAREFVDIAKGAFVDESTEKFGLYEKPASMTATAKRTGLSRKEVKRLKGKYIQCLDWSRQLTPSDEGFVLGRWFSDPRFVNSVGQPVPLRVGPGERTIATLVQDIELRSPLHELIGRMLDTGHIVQLDDGSYVPVRRNYSSRLTLEGIAVALDTAIMRSAQTIAHNLNSTPERTWIQRTVISDGSIVGDELHLIRRAVRAKATSFCEEIDDLLAAKSTTNSSEIETESGGRKFAGIGVFYFEDDV